MTVLGIENSRSTVRRPLMRSAVPDHGLDVLRERVELAVRGTMSEVEDQLLGHMLREAVQAFVDHDADPRAAAAQVAPWAERIGERQARLGQDVTQLAQQFQRARECAQRGLRDAVGDAFTGKSLVHLRQDLMQYLELLFQHTRRGLEREHRAQVLGADACRDQLSAALFEQMDQTSVAHLARTVHLPDLWYVPLVAVGGVLPDGVLHHSQVLHRLSGDEAAAPSNVDLTELIAQSTVQIVTGPPARVGDLSDAISLTRRAAALLASGLVQDTRRIVACSDLLGALMVGANPMLSHLLEAKHLTALEAMGESRRVKVAETLLKWLEHGVPANQLARQLGLPQQTVHSRLKTARTTFGDVLEDPNQRLELIFALRTALPRWRATS